MNSVKDSGEMPLTFGNRIATAFCSTIVMSLFLILLPLLLSLKGGLAFGLYYHYDRFLTWCAVVIVITAITGFALGTERMTDLFGHLWGTAEPERPMVSALLWLAILGCAAITYSLVPSTMP